MKYILNIVLASLLVSCTVSPERQSIVDEYQIRADAEKIQTATHGSMKGTPENIAGISESQNRAEEFQKKSDDKELSILEDILATFISLWIWGET